MWKIYRLYQANEKEKITISVIGKMKKKGITKGQENFYILGWLEED